MIAGMSYRYRGVSLGCLLILACTNAAFAAVPSTQPSPKPGSDVIRSLRVDGRTRSYLVHLPTGYDPAQKTPVVLIFHGAYTNATVMVNFSGLNVKSDAAGFIAAYPNGLGIGDGMLFFNAWSPPSKDGPADDVAFTAAVIDDLSTVANVDSKRVFATGMSNGGMMCYRLAAELSDRIAAIAPVSGTVCIPDAHPKRPVPVAHFHGTADDIVPFAGSPGKRTPKFLKFKSVDGSVKMWADLDGCPIQAKVTELPDTAHDGTQVEKKVYGPGKDGAEVVLYSISGAGHTWPGKPSPLKMLGSSTLNISANDLMWDFFCQHPMK